MGTTVWTLSNNRYTGTLKIPTNDNAVLRRATNGSTYEVLYKSLNKVISWVKADGEWISNSVASGGTGIEYGEVITGYPTDGYIDFTRYDLTSLQVDLQPMAGDGMSIDSQGRYTLATDSSTLVNPTLNSSYIYSDGYTPPSAGNDYGVNVARGVDVTYTSSFTYILGTDEAPPQTVTGDYGTTIPPEGVYSTSITGSATTNTTKTVTFHRNYSGLGVVGNKIVILDEVEETTSKSMSIRFKENIYIGGIDHTNATVSDLNSLLSSTLYSATPASIRRTDIDVGNNYLYVGFPVSMGDITDVIINDAQSIGIYTFVDEGTLDLTNDGGIIVTCNIYRSTARNPYPPSSGINSLTFVF